MYLRRLSLSHFRCYRRLELTLPCGPIVVAGRNAQGKTSLLEACYLLATSRSPHASADREWVHWEATDEVLPHGRILGEIARAGESRSVEILNLREEGEDGEARWTKRIKVNGVPRRAIDVLGHLNVVLFTPQDLRIVDAGPSERRRYLDGLLCQIDPAYCRALSRYNRVLVQRNSLLRKLRERGGGAERGERELPFWDERLGRDGSLVLARRVTAVERLGELVSEAHASLAGPGPALNISYRASLAGEVISRSSPGFGIAEAAAEYRTALPADAEAIQAIFLRALAERRREEIARGASVVGPHRDDLSFAIAGVDMRTYGSRGQQRTVTLALKLAEARLMWSDTGERPVLLLDDVLGELDPERRELLVAHLDSSQQTLITTTDPASLPAAYLDEALLLELEAGEVVRAEQAGRAVTPPVV